MSDSNENPHQIRLTSFNLNSINKSIQNLNQPWITNEINPNYNFGIPKSDQTLPKEIEPGHSEEERVWRSTTKRAESGDRDSSEASSPARTEQRSVTGWKGLGRGRIGGGGRGLVVEMKKRFDIEISLVWFNHRHRHALLLDCSKLVSSCQSRAQRRHDQTRV